jgi:phosphoribosylformylglycinamidine cyclo-ligase
MQTSITYKDAGVDIDAGDALVDKIKPFAKRTLRPEVLAGIGGFGAMFELSKKYTNPILVSGTDGVGTKLKLAFELNQHDTIGIDLVAMSVNDILVQGAEPLFFLDYFACGKLDVAIATQVISGVALGCEYSGCSLIGGETAEMPGMYPANEYDLAGFAVGVAEKSAIIDGSKLQEGDVIIGVASSGFHSNGYSLVRKLIKHMNLDLSSSYDDTHTWGEAIMAPTQIYVKPVLELLKLINPQDNSVNQQNDQDNQANVNMDISAQSMVHAMAHITGGGITGNLARVFPNHLAAEVKLSAMPKSRLFSVIQEAGNLSDMQMLETFNCGIGYAVVVASSNVDYVLAHFAKHNMQTYQIGTVIKRDLHDVVYI